MRLHYLAVLAFLGITLLCAFPNPAAASTPHVLRVGTYRGIKGQYATIQDAVNAARPGDWVLVAPGDYHEQTSPDAGVVIRTAGIHLRGMDRNGVVVDGTSPLAPARCSANPVYQVPGRNGILVDKASGV